MDRRHLWIRTERQQRHPARARTRSSTAVRDFFDDRGFILADTPIFTPAACEGTTTLFPVQYFDDTTAYLTQSGQLYNEANAMALGRVYCFGPTFRAEKSKTRRHLTEFWMVEPEVAYADARRRHRAGRGAGGLGRRARARAAPARADSARARHRRSSSWCKTPFPRITLRRGGDDAATRRASPSSGAATSARPTRRCSSSSSTGPVRVHRYPSQVKAFYMKPDPQRPEVALCVDVLAPEGYGEIIGGGQRIADYDLLLQRIKEHNLPPEAFEWYLDLRRYGSRAARRLRHGHRARGQLDLRPRPPARGDPVPADAVPAVSVAGLGLGVGAWGSHLEPHVPSP